MNRCNSGTDSKVWMRKGKRIFTAETPEVLAVFVYKEGELMDDIKYMRRALELARMAEGDTNHVYLVFEGAKTFNKAGYMHDSVHYSQYGYNIVGKAFARFIANHQFSA